MSTQHSAHRQQQIASLHTGRLPQCSGAGCMQGRQPGRCDCATAHTSQPGITGDEGSRCPLGRRVDLGLAVLAVALLAALMQAWSWGVA